MFPERKCENCANYRCEAMGDYGSGPHDIYCTVQYDDPDAFMDRFDGQYDPAEDDNFPYDEAPDCFEPEFWLSDFAKEVDWTEGSLDRAYTRFREHVELHNQ